MSRYIVETRGLTKQYGTQKSVADLHLHIAPGRIYGLLGATAPEKTTTMKMLLGLTRPTSGEVFLWGTPLPGHEKELLPRIGSLIEAPVFYPNLTATENLRIFATLRGVPNRHAIRDALELVGLPYRDKKLFSQYSMGMKQRLAIALAVMPRPGTADSGRAHQRPGPHRHRGNAFFHPQAVRGAGQNDSDFQPHPFGDFFAGG